MGMLTFHLKDGATLIINAVDEMHIHPGIEETYQIEGEDSEYMEEVDGRTHWVPGTYACRPGGQGSNGCASLTRSSC